ncbi:Uncharacterized protein QTN25_002824 [Entamoeba marina]
MESTKNIDYMCEFNKSLEKVKTHDYALNAAPIPQPKKMDFSNEKFDLFKYSRACVCRDIKCHHALRHVHCNDKTQPQIPQHTKPLKDFSFQHLLNDIRTEHRLA